MQQIEIWPTEIEFGDAIGEGFTATFMRAVDPAANCEVLLMLNDQVVGSIISQLEMFRTMMMARNKHN